MRSPISLICVLALLLSACATAQSGDSSSSRRRSNVLTAEELAASTTNTAWDAIRQLRPSWLRSRGTRSFGGEIYPRVIVDSMTPEPMEYLHNLDCRSIQEIRYFDPREATTRFGTGFPSGAIVVTTKG
ncbi:MAG: hypothetical protein KAJ42_09555 [Gemmatimonadetes bacterium]|nr:hypothetical protein [Gemmatimonadota bacterium]